MSRAIPCSASIRHSFNWCCTVGWYSQHPACLGHRSMCASRSHAFAHAGNAVKIVFAASTLCCATSCHLDMPTRNPGTGFLGTRRTQACNAARGHCPARERTPWRGQTPRLRKAIPTPPTATAKMAASAIAGKCHRAELQPPHPRPHPRSATQPIRGPGACVDAGLE